MSTIVTRLGKGSPLTYAEGDANFTNLNNDKTENTAFNAHTAATSAHGVTGAIVGTTDVQTLTSKTVNLLSNTLTGTKAQFDAACSDDNFAYQSDLPAKENISNKAINFITVNDTLYPSVQAVKTYADSLVVGLLDDRGNYDASTNLFPSTGGSGVAGAILKGDLWYITVAGTLGGAYIAVGDTIRALVDSPGQIASNWASMQKGGVYLQYFTEARNTTAPNATVPVHSFTALGAETNVDVALSPKGTGALTAQVADNTATGGNKRGANAVDWQTARTINTQVASGDYSSLLGGSTNTASGQGSVVCGGVGNMSPGLRSFVGGGDGNVASGDFSIVPGGEKGTTRGLTGRYSYASGAFAVIGDSQMGRHIQRLPTTDATASILTADGAAASTVNVSVLPDNYAYTATAIITARNTSTGDMASWKIEGAVKRGTGAATTALVGTPAITTIAKDAGAAAWAVAMVANTTRGSIEIQVTGVAATNIHWVCKLDTVEVG